MRAQSWFTTPHSRWKPCACVSSHLLTRVICWLESTCGRVRVISQVTRFKWSHLCEISSQVKSSQNGDSSRLESESVTSLVTTLLIWKRVIFKAGNHKHYYEKMYKANLWGRCWSWWWVGRPPSHGEREGSRSGGTQSGEICHKITQNGT